jgi:hypothetical protein
MLLKIATAQESFIEYHTDHKIFDGLYLTTDNDAVHQNADALAFELPQTDQNEDFEVIIKHYLHATLTIKRRGRNLMQYLIEPHLEDGKVQGLNPQEADEKTKQLILRAKRMLIEGEL